ncbi:PAS domain-containing hybrid sensor histidine kinase/response regulator [Sinorhizobium fredii]|uniref:histidine kinase n=1 Tax=Sinorhizobium fredii (strain USDA 257) TaxID=1185652 RepID=I3WYC7_SINF2|nr:ATP-binding protein [Sinorhizobium fredii]AFL48633.1 sensory/regulatory protein RpfC [Sinorhizobium fredii USDA 257]
MSEPSSVMPRKQASSGARSAAVDLVPSAVGAATVRRSAIDRETSLGRILFALAGLVAAALLLVVGARAGLHLLPALAAVGALAGAFLLLADDSAASVRASATGEITGKAERQCSATAKLLSTIHDALGDIALIRGMDGRIVQANAVFSRLCGHADVRGLTCASLGLSFEPRPGPDRFIVRFATPAGLRLYDWHEVVIREPATGRLMRHSIARDVTEEAQSARRGEEARLRAEEASQAKSRLLATVTHEIRTPLSGILGMSHLLAQTKLSAEQRNYLADMQQSGHALVQLVEDLIDFSSLSAGRFQLHPSEQDLRLVIENVVEMLSHRAHEKGIEIGAAIDTNVPSRVAFDAARLRQVLFNVIGNAVKFTEAGGVLVTADFGEGRVRIRVDDSGPGMAADELARVFEEFEQAGDDAQRSKGTGLGLAISRRIVEAFGGCLTASSVTGEGSRFEVRFPVEAVDAAAQLRRGVLAEAHVLLLAPDGPASAALAATVETLGGRCRRAPTLAAARGVVAQVLAGHLPLTDIIVDHRHAAQFRELLSREPGLERLRLRKTCLISPEERTSHPVNRMGGYEAWLIRPLREKSLVEVLLGRLTGIEKRDGINDNRPILRAEPRKAAAVSQDGRRVLLAEDDPVNALVLRKMLERAGHTVDHIGDFAALETALQGKEAPGLIVTDFNMPGGDGLALLRRLRGREAPGSWSRVPVVVLTSDMRSDLHHLLLAAGADAVHTKPAEPARFLAEVARLLETGQP